VALFANDNLFKLLMVIWEGIFLKNILLCLDKFFWESSFDFCAATVAKRLLNSDILSNAFNFLSTRNFWIKLKEKHQNDHEIDFPVALVLLLRLLPGPLGLEV
jgi:hypothetical protein